MILIEFRKDLTSGLNILRYRNVDDSNWNVLQIDIETLNLLILNFGIISANLECGEYLCIDNPSTGKNINVKYCGADLELYYYLRYLQQPF